jgi:hypothetical protein
MDPDTPVAMAFAVRIAIAPDVLVTPAPVAISTAPPVPGAPEPAETNARPPFALPAPACKKTCPPVLDAVVFPAVRKAFAPTAEFDEPTINDTEPAEPPVADPVINTTKRESE